MDPFIVAVILIIAGAAFLIFEAFSPGAFMVIPGTVLVIVGLIGAAFPDKLYTWWSPLAALVVAVGHRHRLGIHWTDRKAVCDRGHRGCLQIGWKKSQQRENENATEIART